jgi:protein-tyrosine phosphatase
VTSSSTVGPLWLELDGADNVRDLGGLPTADGRIVQPGRLIRSDSLQELSPSDVRHLVDDLRVRAVADLRTGVEVAGEGPGPMTREPEVDVVHLSLFPEEGEATDAAAVDDEQAGDSAPVLLPWQNRDEDDDLGSDGAEAGDPDEQTRRGAAGVYLRYLDDRADSILAALRLIAGTDGATIVHCAAGKDRTGTVIAMALAEVGVTDQAIIDDYERSAERVPRIFARLAQRPTYAGDMTGKIGDVDKHKPRAITMERMLATIDEIHGGAPAWLRAHGWTEADAAALRHKLLD